MVLRASFAASKRHRFENLFEAKFRPGILLTRRCLRLEVGVFPGVLFLFSHYCLRTSTPSRRCQFQIVLVKEVSGSVQQTCAQITRSVALLDTRNNCRHYRQSMLAVTTVPLLPQHKLP